MTNLITVIALTLLAEAGGEPWAGKMAVASVIYQRAGGDPAKMEAVCLAPRQFSCWNAGKAPVVRQDAPTRAAMAECTAIAKSLAEGYFRATIDADHYHTLAVNPAWNKNMAEVATIGRHRFFWRVEASK